MPDVTSTTSPHTKTPTEAGTALQTAVTNAREGDTVDSRDILKLAAGEYQLSTSTDDSGILLAKSIEIRGAKYGVDARGRSSVGKGNVGYTGTGDP